MAKYIDLPNLKENLTIFLNKKINPIYAKKTEIPSNVSELNNDKSYQTAEEVGRAVTNGVAKIVAGAPEDFDTLKEMSDWISSHETSAAAMNSAISDNSVAIANHTSNSDIHVTKAEKTKWNKLDSDLKDGTIIVAEATKATQDAQGNVINETYAKKTEVPQGTVVDNALSSTSTNPVQNKVVKAEFDKVNSNLDCQQDFVGKELLFNQHSQMAYVPTDRNGLTFKYNQENNTCIIDGTATSSNNASGWFGLSFSSEKCEFITNHKYLVMIKTISGSFPTSFGGEFSGNSVSQNSAKIINLNYTTGNVFSIGWNINSVFNNAEFYTLVVDLTKMYGSGKEPTDAENIAKFFTENYPKISSLPISNYGISKQINESLAVIGRCKNLLNPTLLLQTTSKNGVTCTANGDGTYTLNGTATARTDFNLMLLDNLEVGKKYKLVGCPSGGSESSYILMLQKLITWDNTAKDIGNGGIIEALYNKTFECWIRIEQGTTVNNLIFKPMFTENLNATYDDFVPYTGDGETLTADVAELKNDLSNLKDGTTPAAKAVADEDGNNIKSTYAKKTELDAKVNIADPVFTGSFSQNRKAGRPIGTNSHAEGNNTTASGNSSHAEGNDATAEGHASHAEGDSYTIGDYSHAEGNASRAEGDKSHAEGTRSWGLGSNSHAEGYQTTASGISSHSEGSSTNRVSDITTDFSKETSISDIITLRKSNKFSLAHGYGSHVEGINSLALDRSSHAEGEDTVASGIRSHAEGEATVASGTRSHTEGYGTTASDDCSHAEGFKTVASGDCSHAEGYFTKASGYYSHAEGIDLIASGNSSHAEGNNTVASGDSSHAEGYSTKASNFASHATGKFNASMTTGGNDTNTTGTAFVIGNGTGSSQLSNAFSVQYDGTVKAKSTITASTTADYAEFFEWLDENPNNEDRVGYFVTLDGNRIKIASDNDDYILGIVSGEPFVLGNGDCDTWNGMYLHDEFRRTIYEPAPKVEEVEIKEEREETYIDEETGEEKIRTVEVVVGHEFKEVEGEFDGTRPKLNPEYDNTQQYISRFDRKEWSPVGMLGVLAVRHDGTAKVNGYVTVNKNGIATACDKNIENSYRVIKANTDSVVEIVFR